jgi:hypothetical protein
MTMKQRKEFPKSPVSAGSEGKKEEAKNFSRKSIQELTELIQQSIGKNPQKAAKVIESWVKDIAKPGKKAS